MELGPLELMAPVPFVPTRYQQLPGGPNNVPSLPLGLGSFDSPTSGASSHSSTPPSDVHVDHPAPSLWDMPFSLDAVVPPLPSDVSDLGNGRQDEEMDENADWSSGWLHFNLDG